MRTALGIAKNRLTRTLIPHKLALSNFTQESRTPVELLLCSELRMYTFFLSVPALRSLQFITGNLKQQRILPLPYLESTLFKKNIKER